jgi:hypothetical protein
MAGLSDYLEDQILDHIMKTGAWTAPTNIYWALFTVNPTDAGGGTEVSGGGYVRKIHNAWDVASGGATENTGAITFATATAAWGTVVGVGAFDASSAGNFLFWAGLNASKIVDIGDVFQFADGDLDMTGD